MVSNELWTRLAPLAAARTRVANALENAGVTTLDQLFEVTSGVMARWKNFGKLSRAKLAALGLLGAEATEVAVASKEYRLLRERGFDFGQPQVFVLVPLVALERVLSFAFSEGGEGDLAADVADLRRRAVGARARVG